MNITLCYVEGISDYDTPYFSTLDEQKQYFLTCGKVVIDSVFYPPNYTNSIKFETTDVNLNSMVNYLYFDYLNKTYYYFIDSIDYISEEVIQLNIRLDAIQTYMFNFSITGGYIERKFINRWNTNNINRTYIRENPSNNLFNDYTKEYLFEPTPLNPYWIVVKYADTHRPLTCLSGNRAMNTSEFTYYLFPYYPGTHAFQYYSIVGGNKYYYYFYTLKDYITDNKTLDIFITDRCPLKDITISDDYEVTGFDGTIITPHLYSTAPTPTTPLSIEVHGQDNLLSESIVSLNRYFNQVHLGSFTKNKSTTIKFDKSFVPALLDTNFIRYSFGNTNVETTYPIEELTISAINQYYTYDLFTGSIILETEGVGDIINKRNTCCIDTNIASLEINNDPWKNYLSANKYRWLQAFGNSAINTASSLISPSIDLYQQKLKAHDVIYNKKYLTPKRQRLSKWGKEAMRPIQEAEQRIKGEEASDVLRNTNGIVSQAIDDLNVKAQPISVKQLGNFNNNVYRGNNIYYSYSFVDNIDECAWFFHKNGYLVNEPIVESNATLSYINTRYYFNVVKYKDIIVHLNILESQDICDMIADRLTTGIRLWNYQHGEIGNFTFDNVEKDYITN